MFQRMFEASGKTIGDCRTMREPISNTQDKWGWPLFLVAFEGSVLWSLIFEAPVKDALLVIVGGIVIAFVVFALTELREKIDALSRNSQFIVQFIADQRVADWAKDKPHYEEVRTLMAELIQKGTAPSLPNGKVNLDAAYNTAVKFHLLKQGKRSGSFSSSSD
jgi:hypothetical protein